MATYRGSCHCGAIDIAFSSNKSPAELGARDCQCSFCSKHGASWTSDADGTAEISISTEPGRYSFGTGTAEALFCSECGVAVAVVSEIENQLKAVIRVESLGDVAEFAAHSAPVDLDAEALGERLLRRAKNWTPASLIEKD